MKTRAPLFHMRRQLRQHGQELRRAQRAVVAEQLALMDAFAERMAAEHAAFVARLPDATQRHLAEAEGPPAELDALRKQLH